MFVMIVKDELLEWDDSQTIGRQRRWFSLDAAAKLLRVHRPVSEGGGRGGVYYSSATVSLTVLHSDGLHGRQPNSVSPSVSHVSISIILLEQYYCLAHW